ncbi:MAG TPA: FecR domain-containing protein [Pseudosphingobacterium sp.]|nr:FecR domain-containing protein [Pseudosphingobacterium sp.]
MDHQILKRYFQGQLSDKEREEVEDWLSKAEDLPHGTSYDEQLKETLWSDIAQRVEEKPHTDKRRFWPLAIAAMLLLSLGLIIGLYDKTPDHREQEATWEEVLVPLGKRKQLRFADGTEVLLGGGSAIAYSKQGRPTALRYLKGEIYVSVKPESHRPFKVLLPGNERILVLGTAFNIDGSTSLNQLKVTLVTGKIRFEDKNNKAYVLQPGQQLLRNKNEGIQIQKVDIEQEIAWKNHTLWFTELPAVEVFSQLEREYGVTFEMASSVGNPKITAKFHQAPLDKVLRLLEESTQIHFKRTGNKIIAF